MFEIKPSTSLTFHFVVIADGETIAAFETRRDAELFVRGKESQRFIHDISFGKITMMIDMDNLTIDVHEPRSPVGVTAERYEEEIHPDIVDRIS